MRLPPHVVRRRQGLYLRLRLPADLTRLTHKCYIVRTLRTSDARLARGRAAILSAQVHQAIEIARAEMAGTFLGKAIANLTAEDVRRVRDDTEAAVAALDALSDADRAALAARLDLIVRAREAQLADLRHENAVLTLAIDIHDDARQQGVIEGLRQAIASGAQPAKAKAHAEASAPWTTFTAKFLKSRGDLSTATRTTYEQAFRDFETAVGAKPLADIEARDIARYGEWLEGKTSNRGSGVLGRKTIIRQLGYVKSFGTWARSQGLLSENPGANVSVRERTRSEKLASNKGAKRAFTDTELKRFFDSPLYVGCHTRVYRAKPGRLIYRDSKYWIFILALMTGARIEELASAPATLTDLNGTLCLDLSAATKTSTSPRFIPIQRELKRVGFIEYADNQRQKGLRLIEDREASGDWSKWTNRYLDTVLGDDLTVSFHSFRHAFRQSCSASGIDDYLADKLMGHKSMKGRSMGSRYGQILTPAEAKLAAETLRCPIPLDHLIA
jgi:integrase